MQSKFNLSNGIAFGGVVLAVLVTVRIPISRVEAQAITNPSYTVLQAERGQTTYSANCASCHGSALSDGEFGPSLKGVEFRHHWGSRSVEDLFTYVSTKMPPARPGGLDDDSYADILAYMLQQNGIEPDARELAADPAALRSMRLPAAGPGVGGWLARDVILPAFPERRNPLDHIRAVTDLMLNDPPDGEWLTWRRTSTGLGSSPLRQINADNVRNLRVAWAWTLPNGPNTATPLVHDGVMFAQSYGDKVQALDAATGDLLWQYSYRLPKGVASTFKRALAIYGDRLYVPTSDAHVVALDTRTGRVLWDHIVADYKAGFRLSSGPLVAQGKVMIGTGGIRGPGGGHFIVGLDANTGRELWRFYAIPRPGQPGDNTWNGLPLEKRNGLAVWIPGTYDPRLKLAFFAPSQTYDTGPLHDRVDQSGITNDSLYSNTTLALDPDTGRLVWHFQHQANDQLDLDWAFERQIIDVRVDGVMKRVVVTGGKQSIFDVLEEETGHYQFSIDLGLQNAVTSIDPRTGAKRVDPKLIPGDGQTKMICPHASGGRGWSPTSYDPETKILYVSIVEACMDMHPVAPGETAILSTGYRWSVRPPPGSDGKYGRLEAINLETKKVVWIERQRAPQTTGTLVTAGGLLFAGALDRVFSAYDGATGKRLWKARLNDVPNSSPITYTVNEKQYVAITVGGGGLQATSYNPLVPEIESPPDRGAAVWVFEVAISGE